MITLLEQMNFWHWIAFGLVLLLLELLGTAGYLLWLGLSALLVGAILSAIPMSWSLQWLTFAVFSLFSTWLWWRYQHKKDRAADQGRTLNQRTEQMIGQTCILDQPLPVTQGRIRLGDTSWLARTDKPLEAGTLVEVIAVEGITLIVQAKQ
ncbi:NfeD family protein [Photobacterium chitinilyticum]|uniref:NfeD family protein n=1 Tax=Photobacterium chitinilyticum TaxID=2485123 RepID=A0A3S3RED4_9GAMM|nr:NfeD family protein [Photobacterium chitinilyticum]RWX53105.1 NfeD family protein [Photobacterium chitinilyticum]